MCGIGSISERMALRQLEPLIAELCSLFAAGESYDKLIELTRKIDEASAGYIVLQCTLNTAAL